MVMRNSGRDELVAEVRRWWIDADRDLPWRLSRDPWEILVSETMSQQTQVARVVPAWRAFIGRFPTVADAAAASAGEVVAHWHGLGYNRRAVLLHRCATTVVAEHGGSVPDSLGELLALPGIGPYTARAVLVFAFEQHVAVVDTNVGRVLARWHGRRLAADEVQDGADALVPRGSAWEWNQALLDFGATVCAKRVPGCTTCPVRRHCAWAGVGPDPAVSSARVSTPQPPFHGSDREGRGRLVSALRRGSVDVADLADVMGWPADESRADRVATTVVSDGLARLNGTRYELP